MGLASILDELAQGGSKAARNDPDDVARQTTEHAERFRWAPQKDPGATSDSSRLQMSDSQKIAKRGGAGGAAASGGSLIPTIGSAGAGTTVALAVVAAVLYRRGTFDGVLP